MLASVLIPVQLSVPKDPAMTNATLGEASHRGMPLHTKILIGLIVGVVLGLIALRSNSLLPGIVFHMLFNSIAVLRERASAQLAAGQAEEFQQSHWHWFVTLQESGLRYTWLTLAISGAVASLSLWWVWQSGRAKISPESIKTLIANGLAPAKQQPTCAS